MLVNSSQSTVRSAAKAGPAVPAQMAITMQTVRATATDAVRHRRMAWNGCSFITPSALFLEERSPGNQSVETEKVRLKALHAPVRVYY